jgi:hypothetical protein
MAMPSNRSSISPLPQTQTYGWRTFSLEFLYGLLAIAWYLFALAEMSIFKGLTRLGNLVAPAPKDVSKDGSERSVLLEEADSSLHMPRAADPSECHGCEVSFRIDLQ